MKTKLVISVLVLIFFIGLVSATNIENVGFNVSSELKPSDGVGLQFEDSNEIDFRILDEDIDDMNEGCSKYNDTVFLFDKSNPVGDKEFRMVGYGEYFKFNGKLYWVDAISMGENPSQDICLEYLDYFNGHNNIEPIANP